MFRYYYIIIDSLLLQLVLIRSFAGFCIVGNFLSQMHVCGEILPKNTESVNHIFHIPAVFYSLHTKGDKLFTAFHYHRSQQTLIL